MNIATRRDRGKFLEAKSKALLCLLLGENQGVPRMSARQVALITGLPYRSVATLLLKWARWGHVTRRPILASSPVQDGASGPVTVTLSRGGGGPSRGPRGSSRAVWGYSLTAKGRKFCNWARANLNTERFLAEVRAHQEAHQVKVES